MRVELPIRPVPRRVLLVAAILVIATGSLPAQTGKKKENRWEPNVRRFETQDRQNAPPENGILFIGSSSIVGWHLDECFHGLPVINRGFGGSHLADSVHFAERIVLPYKPKIIVLYAGDNDVAAGKSPRQVLGDYRQFVDKVHRALPNTRIVFIAIKPSIRRWKLVGKMREANKLIRAATEKDGRLVFVDIDEPMIGDDGKPRTELFQKDGLHLNAEGYKLWSDLLRPHLRPEQPARGNG